MLTAMRQSFGSLVTAAWASLESMGDTLVGSGSALAIKLVSAGLGFAMFALLAEVMGPAEFGMLAVVFNAVSFLAVLAPLGQETLIVRSWQEYIVSARPALAHGVLRFGSAIVVCSALAIAVATGLAWHWWSPALDAALLAAASVFLALQAIMHFTGQFSRVAAGLVIGEGPREVSWRLLALCVVGYHYLYATTTSTTEFFMVAAIGLAVGILYQIIQIARSVPRSVWRSPPEYDRPAWTARSVRMWLAALLDTTGQYLEVVIIGLLLGPVIAGAYFVCTRITNVASMIAGSISMYATVHISGLYFSGSTEELQREFRRLAIIVTVLVAGALATIIWGGSILLSFFGPSYQAAYYPLVVLAVGACLTALSGPTEHLLLLTGNESTYTLVASIGLACRLALAAAGGLAFGLVGVAWAVGISSLATALALVIACRRVVGIDPSALALVSKHRSLQECAKCPAN
jgi:O-antigen/teichoic acid export membrane protein